MAFKSDAQRKAFFSKTVKVDKPFIVEIKPFRKHVNIKIVEKK